MNTAQKVLIVGADPVSSVEIEKAMSCDRFSILKASSFDDALSLINSENVSKIILGQNSSSKESFRFIKQLSKETRGRKAMICHLTDSDKVLTCFPKVASEITQFSLSREAEIHQLREKFHSAEINSHGNEKAEKVDELLTEVFGTLKDYNSEMSDSIRYASTIQKAILPGEHSIRRIADSFVFNSPKNILSGDFFWFTVRFNRVIIAVADCTGHGIPGALLSLIGHDMLNTIVNEKNINEPAKILKQLNQKFQRIFENKEVGSPTIKDGMDIAIVSINPENRTIDFAGARRPLTAIVDGQLIKLKGDFHSIGVHTPVSVEYNEHRLIFGADDMFYLGSDGFADQFGGSSNKKIGSRQYEQILSEVHQFPTYEQKAKLQQYFNDWKQYRDQTDDVLVLGIRPGSLL